MKDIKNHWSRPFEDVRTIASFVPAAAAAQNFRLTIVHPVSLGKEAVAYGKRYCFLLPGTGR